MEFVEGHQLTEDIRSTGMALEQVERYGIQLADALSHAHGRRDYSRDLKSANVNESRHRACSRLLDFRNFSAHGCRRWNDITRFDKSWESQHTFGTLPYVAPEVFKGQEADERATSGRWVFCSMMVGGPSSISRRHCLRIGRGHHPRASTGNYAIHSDGAAKRD
jgi:serine/threonine protein kinase